VTVRSGWNCLSSISGVSRVEPLSLYLIPRLATCTGISELRANREGFPLPNPRVVSAQVHRDEGPHDHVVTLMFAAWGQLMDHDLTFTAETKGTAHA
jgi:hypothetical protein